MEIRKDLTEMLLYHCKDTFENLEQSLNNIGELDHYLWMNASESELNDSSSSLTRSQNLEHNSSLLTQEIFDDIGCALSCFLIGYFKQTQAMLRGSVELTIQLWKNKYEIEQKGVMDNTWVRGIRGIEKIDDACKEIETLNENISGIKDKIRKLNKLYSNLCKSTHSHKKRLNVVSSPRMHSTLKAYEFEPLEFLYTKRSFFYTLRCILDLLLLFFEHQKFTHYKTLIIGVLKDEIGRLDEICHLQNSNYEKGFLIFRESLKISDEKKIEIYSIDEEGTFKELSKIKTKLNNTEQKMFRRNLAERILSGK